MMAQTFQFDPNPGGGLLSLEERKVLLKRKVPFREWRDTPARRYIGQLVSIGSAQELEHGVQLETAGLLDMPPSVADAIGLPPPSNLSLGISLKGRIETPSGELRQEWRDPDHRSVTPQRLSIFVKIAERWNRLSPSVYQLTKAIDGYNQTRGCSGEDRIPAWVEVQQWLERTTGEEIRAEQLLQSFRIYQAGAFSLDVRESVSGPVFNPLLMAKGKRPLTDDLNAAPENGDELSPEIVDETDDALLSSAFHKSFTSEFGKHVGLTRASYVVGRNAYVVIAPELRQALDVVRRVSNSSVETRRQFVRNPRSFLAEEMGDLGEEVGSLFVETQAYSERVIGLGLWEKPVLPWGQRAGNGWLPEKIELNVDGKSLSVTREDLPNFVKTVEDAATADAPIINWTGEEYPVNSVRLALGDLGISLSGEDPSSSSTNKSNIEPADKNVLLIKTNLEELQYSAHTRRLKKIKGTEFPREAVPRTIPKPHQETGFQWLAESWASGRPGVLLADDMGLGKTLQALAFLAWVRPLTRAKGPIIIVAPTALLRNWQNEVEQHLAPDTLGDCLEIFGKNIARLKKAKSADWTPEDALDVDRLKSSDWILTTYETLANYHRSFARIPYSIAIFDEMQKIKAPDTINSHAANTINADFVLGLTGTPIENRIEDLWSIMDRVHSGFLGTLKDFSAEYGSEQPEPLKLLKARLDTSQNGGTPVLLRRMKEDHLPGLPSRTFNAVSAKMPTMQAAIYEEAVIQAARAQGKKGEMLKAIHALRGISLHPRGGKDVDPYDAESRKKWISESARVLQTLQILNEIRASNEKALVFIEDRAVQSIFAATITQEFGLRFQPAVINGETPGDRRQNIVNAFQASVPGFDMLVLSPKAAGIGLTITAANHVIHLSRWWNPAVEDQCNDRVFRIGQTKSVTVHIPLAIHPTFGESSFDVKLDQLLSRKRNLSRHMLAPPVGQNDVEELFEATVQ